MSKSEVSTAIERVNKALSPQMNDVFNTSTMSSLILSVCLIDTLSSFHSGFEGKGSKHKARFNKFTKQYLPEYTDLLYNLRNDVIHSFSNLSNLLFTESEEFKSTFPQLKSILGKEVFDVKKFKNRMVEVYNEFLSDVGDLENNDLRSNFMKRYKSLGIISDFNIPVMKNFKGEIKTHIDEMDRLPGTDIPIGFAHPIKTKS